MGELAKLQYETKESIKFFEASLHFSILSGNCFLESIGYFSLGRSYYMDEQYEKALQLYNKAKILGIEIGQLDVIMDASSGIASTHIHYLKDPQAALDEIENTLRIYNNNIVSPEREILLGNIYLELQKYDLARYYIESHLNRANLLPPEKGACYYVLYLTYFREGDYRNAVENLNIYRELSQEYFRLRYEDSIAEMKEKYRNRELAQRVEFLRKKQIYQWAIVGLLISLFMGILFYVRHQRNIKLGEYEMFVEQLRQDNAQLQRTESRLSEVLNEWNEKEAAMKKALENRIEAVKKVLEVAAIYGNSPEVFYQKFKEHIWNREDAFLDMQEVVNTKYHGIVNVLRERYPKLNHNEIDLCCMLIFGFTNAQLSLIYDYTNPSTIYQKRNKLRKKMNLTGSDQNIETHLNHLIAELSHNSGL